MTRIRHLALYTATCFIIAAKYDELDENIPLISDLQRYYTIKVLPPQIPAPSYDEVIECERTLMAEVFEWDLMSIADMMPTHLVNYMLANGIVFENEVSNDLKGVETAARVSDRTLIMLDTLVWERGATRVFREAKTSKLSAAVIFAARLEEFRHSKKITHED